MKNIIGIVLILFSLSCNSQSKLTQPDSIGVRVATYLAEKKFEVLESGITNVINDNFLNQDSSIVKMFIDVDYQQLRIVTSAAGSYTNMDYHEPDTTLLFFLKRKFLNPAFNSVESVSSLNEIMRVERGYFYNSTINTLSYKNKTLGRFAFLEIYKPIGGWQNLYINYYSCKKPLEEKNWLLPFNDNKISVPIRLFLKEGVVTVIKNYIYTVSFNCSDKGVINIVKGELLLLK